MTAPGAEINFDPPASKVGFFYASFSEAILKAFDASGNLVGSDSGPSTTFPDNDYFPLGVTTGEDIITRVTITATVFGTIIDNVTASRVVALDIISTGGKCNSVLGVAIDIKPGSFPNSINLGSNGNVPVAILSAPDFDATAVDPASVTLASAPLGLKGKGTPMASTSDVNGDGLLDLIVHVDTSAFELSETDTEAVLEGLTFDGVQVRGVDSIRVVP